MADLRCSRTRLPIPGRYEQRVVQLTDVVRAQEPPDYVTQLHTAGAGVYCSPVCAWLHLLESLILDGDLPRESLNARTAVTQPTPCEAAATPRPVHEEPF